MEMIFSLEEISTVATGFWRAAAGKKVFAFHGPMGAGKTTFIHALCEIKQVKDVVSSPTFSIINEYEYLCEGTPKAIFHIDLYRLKDEEEAQRAGVEDVLHSGHICLVEWPERAPGIFPEDTVQVILEILPEEMRRIFYYL
jgi:tRNA threonylcarbamoyladenosine biosynthesis protein TsaE